MSLFPLAARNVLLSHPGPRMPNRPVGLWFADRYQSLPTPYIPNDAVRSALAPIGNIFRMPRRNFAAGVSLLSNFWTRTGSPTLTENAGTAPDGSNSATRMQVGAGVLAYVAATGLTLPAGTYTIACAVKSNTGSDQTFKQWLTSGNSTVQTATATWQRISYTQTLGAGSTLMIPISSDGTNALDVLFCDATLHVGASDLGPDTLVGHIELGRNTYDSAIPTYASGEIDYTITAGCGAISFSSPLTLSAMTAIVLSRRIGSVGTYSSFLMDYKNTLNFGAMWAAKISNGAGGSHTGDTMGAPNLLWGGASNMFAVDNAAFGSYQSNTWDPPGAGTTMQTMRYDGTTSDLFLNRAKIASHVASGGPVTISDLISGYVNSAIAPNHKWTAMALYDRALTDSEIARAYQYLKLRAASSGVTVQTPRLILPEGDSETAGNNPANHPYPCISGPLFNPPSFTFIKAIGASYYADVLARLPALLTLCQNKTITPIVSFFLGTNDLYNWAGATDADAAADYLSAYAAITDQVRATGAKVIVCTILPCTTGSTAQEKTNHENRRQIINPILVNDWPGTHCDAVADIAADPNIGAAGAQNNTTYYLADAIHLNNTGGHPAVDAIWRPVVDSL